MVHVHVHETNTCCIYIVHSIYMYITSDTRTCTMYILSTHVRVHVHVQIGGMPTYSVLQEKCMYIYVYVHKCITCRHPIFLWSCPDLSLWIDLCLALLICSSSCPCSYPSICHFSFLQMNNMYMYMQSHSMVKYTGIAMVFVFSLYSYFQLHLLMIIYKTKQSSSRYSNF